MSAQLKSGIPRAQGAYAQLDELLRLRYAAQELRLHPRRRALSQLSGARGSNFRGRGLEFEELRAYQPGDELRALDWRVTARTGQPHTRLYREERERPTLLLLDQRQTMFFGSQVCFKSVQALHCAALLAWAALAGNDRLGGLVIGPDGHQEVRPRRSRHAVLQLLEQGLRANQALRAHSVDRRATALSEALLDLRRIARPGSVIILISDFHDWNDDADEQCALLARHCEVNAVQVSDRLERELLPPGRYRLSDGLTVSEVDTWDKARSSAVLAHRIAVQRRLELRLRAVGAPLIELDTAVATIDTLKAYFGRRRRGVTG